MGIQEVFLLEDTVEAGILKEPAHCRKCSGLGLQKIFFPGITVRETVTREDRGEGWIRMECSLCHFKAPRHKYLEHLKFQQ